MKKLLMYIMPAMPNHNILDAERSEEVIDYLRKVSAEASKELGWAGGQS